MLKKSFFLEIGTVLAGSALFALSLAFFLTPCGIVTGGATGIAVTAHELIGFPVGIGIFLVNTPLVLLNMRLDGVRGMIRTVVGIAATSVLTDLLSFFPAASEEPLLSAICGGAMMGAGAGIMLMRGYTTGGSDLAAYLLHRRIRRIPVGTLILIIDAFIIVGAAIVQRQLDGILYSVAATIAYSFSIDAVMNGMGRAKLALIISDRYAEIGDAITKKISRGATVLRGIGWYTGVNKNVVMCVMKRAELFALQQLVKEIDPAAFMIITDAAEVIGSGFSEEKPKS